MFGLFSISGEQISSLRHFTVLVLPLFVPVITLIATGIRHTPPHSTMISSTKSQAFFPAPRCHSGHVSVLLIHIRT